MTFMLAVVGGETVRAGKIIAIGKNYAEHAREMGGDAPPEPVLFQKPTSCLVASGGHVVIPDGVGAVHHEAELAVVIGDMCRRVAPADALDRVLGYAAFLDMTARDLQTRAKKAGLPWTLSKGIDTFGPIGAIAPAERIPDPGALDLELKVNGSIRQVGRTSDMTHRVEDLIAYVTRFMTLERGDVLATGTPAGVGPVEPGDDLRLEITGVPVLEVGVRAAEL